MPRPRKIRKICCIPGKITFGPRGIPFDESKLIQMTLDEYEAIRLIDFEGLKQEECAIQMNVARTTIQSIYQEARKKLSMALIQQKWLFVDGGDIEVCDDEDVSISCEKCRKNQCCKQSSQESKE